MRDRHSSPPPGFRLWLILAAVVILAGVVVPYGLLAGPGAGLAVAVFWLLFGFVVVGLIAVGVARWRDEA